MFQDLDWLVLARRTGEHVSLTLASTGVAVLVGVPLGVLATRRPGLRGALLGLVGVLQTLPPLALLATLLAVTGQLGAVPALVALTLYALLPVVRNTVVGLEGVPAGSREAAAGVGMSPRQSLLWVELPLAAPVILTGVRVAAVVGVGVTTLAAFCGAGGLGAFINEGLALRNDALVLTGAIPAAILALAVDRGLAQLACRWAPGSRGKQGSWLGRASLVLVALLVVGSTLDAGARWAFPDPRPVVRVGSMNFTEQLILGELMAQRIEVATDLRVERQLNLGATMILHEALRSGAIDLYPEYTGSALMAILHLPVDPDPDRVLATVRQRYLDDFDVEWMQPFGFNNTYVLSVRKADAAARGWATISDLVPDAPELVGGFVAEFTERDDGLKGLKKSYGLTFADERDIDTNLMYEAISRKEVDVVCNYSTDGRILVFDLAPLEDDRRFFPPYHAAPILRRDTLARHPELRAALAPLQGAIDAATMQRLNLAVDEHGKSPRDVARDFLAERGLGPPAR